MLWLSLLSWLTFSSFLNCVFHCIVIHMRPWEGWGGWKLYITSPGWPCPTPQSRRQTSLVIMLIMWIVQNDPFYAQDISDRHSSTSHVHLGKGGTSTQGLKLLYFWVLKEVPYFQSRLRKCLSNFPFAACHLINTTILLQFLTKYILSNKSKFLVKY